MATSPEIDSPQLPYWRANMLTMSVATFCLTLGFGMTNPFMPLVLKEMGAPGNLETWVGYAMGGYFGISFLLTPLWGVVADHYGRKLMVLRTSFGMGLIYLLMPLSPTLGIMLGLFWLMGTTNGFVPSSQALIATNTPQNQLGRCLGTLQTGTLLGATLGPAAGAVLAAMLPQYRYLFWASGILILAAGLVALVFAKEVHQRPAGPFRLNLLRDLLIIIAIRPLRVVYLTQFTYTFVSLGSFSLISVYALDLLALEGIEGGSAVNYWIGAISLAMTIASTLSARIWGHALDRVGSVRILKLALGLTALASIPQIIVQTPLQLTMARALLGLAVVGISPASVALVRNLAPRGMESRVLAYGAAFGALGIGAAPFAAGVIGPLLGLRVFFGLNTVLLLGTLTVCWRKLRQQGAPGGALRGL